MLDYQNKNAYFRDIVNTEGYGKGIRIDKNADLKVTFANCSFINCTNHKKASVFHTSSHNLYLTSMVVNQCLFNICNSPSEGAIALVKAASVMRNLTFRLCSSDNGACINCKAFNFHIIKDCWFYDDYASNCGGGVFADELKTKHEFI